MGEARRRRGREIGRCVYCGATDSLSDEHVVPYGLGGTLVLRKASCPRCALVTSKLEYDLLRGHWRAQRQFFGLPSRRSKEVVPDLDVVVVRANGDRVNASLPLKAQSIGMYFELSPPTILAGRVVDTEPAAGAAFIKTFGEPPREAIVNGLTERLSPEDKIEIPIDFTADHLCRFLAKLAHCYAISQRGLDACREFFLPAFILGKTAGIVTYVGGSSSTIVGNTLPGSALHALIDRVNGEFLTVYVQLFRTPGDPPPIYEIVVGRIVD